MLYFNANKLKILKVIPESLCQKGNNIMNKFCQTEFSKQKRQFILMLPKKPVREKYELIGLYQR